jgi:hypothetical protein
MARKASSYWMLLERCKGCEQLTTQLNKKGDCHSLMTGGIAATIHDCKDREAVPL